MYINNTPTVPFLLTDRGGDLVISYLKVLYRKMILHKKNKNKKEEEKEGKCNVSNAETMAR